VGTLYDHSERYRMLSVRSRLRDTLEEHAGIYEPAVARNSAEAVGWLRRHLSNTVANLEQGMAVAPEGSEAASDTRPAATLEGVTVVG
jgi:DNA-binding GntR family transcriptional regulator